MGKLLVIDAETAGRSIVRGRLADAGHDVRVAEEGAAGVEVALEQAFDCVLIAARLEGDRTGEDVCRQLHGQRGLEHTPLIVYSLLEEDDQLLPRALAAGAHTSLQPEDAGLLERVVDASITPHQRVASLRDRLEVQRQEQRALSEQLGGEAGGVDPGVPYPDGVLLIDGRGVVRHCDRASWSLLGRNCLGTSLRQLAPASGLDRFVREARTSVLHGLRFDLPGHAGAPGRPLVASVHPLGGGLRLLFLNDRARCEALGDDRLAADAPGQASALLDAAARAWGLDQVPGDGSIAHHLRRSIAARACDREPLLLVGERGSGRGFLARALHHLSPEPGPFLGVRCSCLSPDSLERELFGRSTGSDGGAGRPGALLLAGSGTVLLEDVEALPLDLQGRLLEVLQTGSLSPGGPTCTSRIIVSTSRDLEALAVQGTMLPELVALLGTWRLEVPPLRARQEELGGILQEVLDRAGAIEPDEELLTRLRQYCWLQNLDELMDVVAEAVRSAAGDPLRAEHLPQGFAEQGMDYAMDHLEGQDSSAPQQEPPPPWAIGQDDPISFEHYEKQAIVRALHACGGDRLEAARMLEVGKSTLYRKIRNFGL